MRNWLVVLLAAIVVAIPLMLAREQLAGGWREGDPVLRITSPHNEAIRYEFARAFSAWEQSHGRRPVKIEWVSVGGTTEITNYLNSTYTRAVQAWWQQQGHPWNLRAADAMLGRRFDASKKPADLSDADWQELIAAREQFRSTDDPRQFSAKVDLFFGGGQFDHHRVAEMGFAVAPWPAGKEPSHLFVEDGIEIIPEALSGEVWRGPTLFGTCLSTFGICYNLDRLDDLGIPRKPAAEWQWDDLADPRFYRQVGVADPTKSGSIAKAFEMLIQSKIHQRLHKAGYDSATVAQYEAAWAKSKTMPESVPAAYQHEVEQGWLDGIRLVQLIGANARYFTDSASKVPIDVGAGDAAIGMAIDFYGRYQAQFSKGADGAEHMVYVTPIGGTSASADPITLLRGAGTVQNPEWREVAVRFIEFTLSEEGQRLWTYEPGSVGGPEKYPLRRLPIRRDFYPSTQPGIDGRSRKHLAHAVDQLNDPTVDPYALSEHFIYYPRWTAGLFAIQRDIVKALCMDSGDELRNAWRAIIACDDPAKKTAALKHLSTMPTVTLTDKQGASRQVPFDWQQMHRMGEFDSLEYMRVWVETFRRQYVEAQRIAD